MGDTPASAELDAVYDLALQAHRWRLRAEAAEAARDALLTELEALNLTSQKRYVRHAELRELIARYRVGGSEPSGKETNR